MLLSRQTIIALRARHTAFRVAMEILHPPQPPAALSASDLPLSSDDAERAIDVLAQFRAWEWQERQARRRQTMRRLGVLLWTAAGVLGAWNWQRKAAPPSPLAPLPTIPSQLAPPTAVQSP